MERFEPDGEGANAQQEKSLDTLGGATAAHQAPVTSSVEANGSDENKPESSASIASEWTLARLSDPAPSAPRILSETSHRQYTAKAFSLWLKWTILTGMLLVQISQNYNAAVYNSAVPDFSYKFGISEATARLAQMIFLVMYAFGCELWAPFSEEFGRKWVLQLSLLLVNCFQTLVALSPSWSAVFAGRALGGLSSAGGSVTLGMVADMFDPEDQFQAVAFTCFGSVVGSVIAPIVSGKVAMQYNGIACIWISVAIGVFTQAVHMCLPETRPENLLDRAARKQRKTDAYDNVKGPREVKGTFWERISLKKVGTLMWRPYWLLLTEPIVLALSLLSGFSDSLIFSGLDSFGLVLSQWGFNMAQVGYSFFALFIGYMIAYGVAVVHFACNPGRPKKNNAIPEQRLWLLLWLVPLMPIGLMCLGFTSLGPAYKVHWTGPVLSVLLIGIANYAIYLHTIDYLVAAYGPYAASATGGNGFCRDFLAGIAAIYTVPMYENIAPMSDFQLVWPTFMLACIGFALTAAVYLCFFKGAWLRSRSKYASALEQVRAGNATEDELQRVG